MSSSKDYLQFILGQLSGLEEIKLKEKSPHLDKSVLL